MPRSSSNEKRPSAAVTARVHSLGAWRVSRSSTLKWPASGRCTTTSAPAIGAAAGSTTRPERKAKSGSAGAGSAVWAAPAGGTVIGTDSRSADGEAGVRASSRGLSAATRPVSSAATGARARPDAGFSGENASQARAAAAKCCSSMRSIASRTSPLDSGLLSARAASRSIAGRRASRPARRSARFFSTVRSQPARSVRTEERRSSATTTASWSRSSASSRPATRLRARLRIQPTCARSSPSSGAAGWSTAWPTGRGDRRRRRA